MAKECGMQGKYDVRLIKLTKNSELIAFSISLRVMTGSFAKDLKTVLNGGSLQFAQNTIHSKMMAMSQ